MTIRLSPPVKIALLMFLLSFSLQWLILSYLTSLGTNQLNQVIQQAAEATTKHLAEQFSSQLSKQDDLGALTVIKSAQQIYPKLHTLMIINYQGQILLHTHPELMGTNISVPSKMPSDKLIVNQVPENNMVKTKILVKLPNHSKLYCYAIFNDHHSRQRQQQVQVRLFIMIALSSLLIAVIIAWLVNKFIQHATNEKTVIDQPLSTTATYLAKRLINDSTIMIIDNHNKILAASANFIPSPANRDESLYLGKHIIHAGFSNEFMQAISQLTQQPNQERVVRLSPKRTVKLNCYPPDQNWQFILVTS